MSIIEETTPVPAPSTPTPADPEALQTKEERARVYRQNLKKQADDSPQRLKAILLKKRDDLRGREKDARLRRLAEIGTMIRYNEGDMWGEYKIMSGDIQWSQAPLMPFDQSYAIPLTTGHVREAVAKMLKVNIEYEAQHVDRFHPTKQLLAEMCLDLATKDIKRMFTREVREIESKNLCLGGESLRDVFWGPDPQAPKKAKRIVQKKIEVNIPGRRECGNCGTTVGDATECPSCQATYIKDIQPGKGLGFEPQPVDVILGQNNLHIPNLLSIQYQMTAPVFRFTSYLIERDFLDRKKAEWLYQTQISGQTTVSEESQFQRSVSLSGIQIDASYGSASAYGTGGLGAQVGANDVEREHHFWTVAEYGSIVLGHEEKLPNGKTLPKGTILGEAYPSGLYVCYLGNEVISMEGVNLLRRWSMSVYDKRSATPGGLGMRSMISLNDIVNDSFNATFATLMSFGQPLTAINGKYVETLPEVTQFLKLQNLPEGKDINSVIGRWPATSDGGMGVAMGDKIESVMQFVEGTQTLGNYGGGTAELSTATGINAAEAQSFGRMVAPTGSLITSDMDVFYQCLENIRDFSVEEQKKALIDRYGKDVFKMFMECNFRQDILVTVKGDTDIPRSLARSVANITAFAQAAGQLNNLEPAERAEILSLMGDALGISYAVGVGRTDRREAEYRLNMLIAIEEEIRKQNPRYLMNEGEAVEMMLEKLSQFCEGTTSETVNADGMTEVLPNPMLHDDAVFMDVYKDFIFGERGRNASPQLRMAVLTMWYAHVKASEVRAQKSAILQSKLEKLLNPQPAQPSPEEMMAMQEQERTTAIEDEALRIGAEEQVKERDHERAMEQTEHAAQTEVLKAGAMQAIAPQQNGNATQ